MVFDLDEELTQKSGSGKITNREKTLLSTVTQTKKAISRIKQRARDGRLTQDEANYESYRAAKRVERLANRIYR